ncbi:hypothetical protein [Rufibacter sp. LB8]|uniref:hypothetical protein n=1 Tax=Rufibacter sp. LB8 TaxID=2777781 RepID=UPI00178C40C5|nr:hypothetical protein [Rufibacter sp. LB8]
MKTKYLLSLLITLLFAQFANAQENNTVTLTVTGDGKTKDEATQNALRNAIEQAFGAFISSKTEILNDKLIKDEIVSVSNGNIQNYEVLTETQALDGTFTNTVKAVVSVTKLTSFIESKGGQVELKGSLFAANIKLQKLNQENEEKAILNLCNTISTMAKSGYDYTITASEPVESKSSSTKGSWEIKLDVEARYNKNLDNMYPLMLNTLAGVSLTSVEIESYKRQNKQLYTILFKIEDTQKLEEAKNEPKNKKNKLENTENAKSTLNNYRNIPVLEGSNSSIFKGKKYYYFTLRSLYSLNMIQHLIHQGIFTKSVNFRVTSESTDFYALDAYDRNLNNLIGVKYAGLEGLHLLMDVKYLNFYNIITNLSDLNRKESDMYDRSTIEKLYNKYNKYDKPFASFILTDKAGSSERINIDTLIDLTKISQSKMIFSFRNVLTEEKLAKITGYKVIPEIKPYED